MKERFKIITIGKLELQVFNTGIIKSTDKVIIKSNKVLYTQKGKELKSAPREEGDYLRIRTRFDGGKCGKNSTITVHILIAKLFVKNPLNKPKVNHKDGNKQNNRSDNLEWVTDSENVIHAIKNGLRKKAPKNSNLPRPLINTATGQIYPSIAQAAKDVKITVSCLQYKLRGKVKNNTNLIYHV